MNCKDFKGTAFESVRVEAPARLHLGFLDLNGSLGRRFGSLGLSIEGIAAEVEISAAATLQVEGPASARVRVLSCAASLIRQLGLPQGAAIRINRAIPDHVGLGSGTQLSLAEGDYKRLSRRLLGQNALLLGAGVGRFLVAKLADRLQRQHMDFASLLDMGYLEVGDSADCTPAVAVAKLARIRF